MAEVRYVKTSMWKDEWFVSLRGDEQRLFLYLLTNQQTNIIGIYPISLREMAFDTGIDQEEVKRIFRDRLAKDGKAYYELGYVVMKNWLKNQNLNPNMLRNAEKCFNNSPSWLRKRLTDPKDSLYIAFESLLKRSEGFKSLKEVEVEGEVEVEIEVEKKKTPLTPRLGGKGKREVASPEGGDAGGLDWSDFEKGGK
jgi:hypothetical protein